jgi:very-short-patch-repair endonuclease
MGDENFYPQSAGADARDKWLITQGYRVLRFWNNDVLTNIEGVMEIIQRDVNEPPPVSSPENGGGKCDDVGVSNK